MLKCKYAGDVNDDGCKTCNGITMTIDGKNYDCATQCGGFEKEDTQQVESNSQQPKKQYQLVKDDSKLKTTLIGCKSGASREVNGMWYKFEAWEEKIVDGDNVNIEAERQKLFNKLNTHIDNQLLDIINVK